MTKPGTADRVAAVALRILTDEGVAAVTMRRVAAEAGVTTMATYRHFPNRRALLRTVADTAFTELGRAWGRREDLPDLDDRLSALLDDFLDFALRKPNLYAYLLTDRREDHLSFPHDFAADRSAAFNPVLDAVRQGIRDGQLRADDPLEVTLALVAPAMGLTALYLGGRFGVDETAFRALCHRTTERILRGCRS